MKVCSYCGAYLQDNATSCYSCGAQQAVAQSSGYNQNYASGYNQGYGSGYNQNYGSGYNQNYASGYNQGYGAADATQYAYNYQDSRASQIASYSAPQGTPSFGGSSTSGSRPATQLTSNRGLLKYILLSIITFGIYGFVISDRIPAELNVVASRYDGRWTKSLLTAIILTIITFGIYIFVWYHGYCNRLGNEARRRGIDTGFAAKDFWLWNILGSLIIVGPFIFTYKMFKTMNQINEHYNTNG